MSDRPAGRGDAFEKLISLRLCVRFIRGLHRVVGLFNKRYLQPDLTHLGGHPRRSRVPRKGCKNWSLSYISGMPRPRMTKFGARLETKYPCIIHKIWVGYICTCVRADTLVWPIFRISETAGPIALKFGKWLESH